MKKCIITASILVGMNLFAQPSNVASLTDVKESVYYLLKDYKDVKTRLDESEAKIKVLEELNKKSVDEKSNPSRSKKNQTNGKEDQIILDYLYQNKNN